MKHLQAQLKLDLNPSGRDDTGNCVTNKAKDNNNNYYIIIICSDSNSSNNKMFKHDGIDVENVQPIIGIITYPWMICFTL